MSVPSPRQGPPVAVAQRAKSAGKPFAVAGFTGMYDRVINVAEGTSTSESRRQQQIDRDLRAAEVAERDVMKLATVRLEGWERQKEMRVRNAFDRIVDRGWYDKSEANLKAIELGHINAVREHYAMRRDKIKTPSLVGGMKTNTWHPLEWADNVNAVDDLSRTTNLENCFMSLLKRKAKQSAKRREEALV